MTTMKSSGASLWTFTCSRWHLRNTLAGIPVSDEKFFTEEVSLRKFSMMKRVTGGIAPSGHEVEWVSWRRYQDRLVEFSKSHPDCMLQMVVFNEMLRNFIEPGLEDSGSRTAFTWGVPVPSNPKHTLSMFVVECLLNYGAAAWLRSGESMLTMINSGMEQSSHGRKKAFVSLHSTGQSFSWCWIWNCLTAWLLTVGSSWKTTKMSKSKENVVYPEMLVERYGLGPSLPPRSASLPVSFRWNLAPEDYVGRINYELLYWNLLNRAVSMINKYFDGQIPAYVEVWLNLIMLLPGCRAIYLSTIHTWKRTKYPTCFRNVWTLISRTNKYIDETAHGSWLGWRAPWPISKCDEYLAASLHYRCSAVRPFMMETSRCSNTTWSNRSFYSLENWLGWFPWGVTVVAKGTPIFHTSGHGRRDCLYQRQMESRRKEWNQMKLNSNSTGWDKFENFDKVESVLQRSKKFLKWKVLTSCSNSASMRVMAGRQILSELPNIKRTRIQFVKGPNRCNLKPRKMMKKICQSDDHSQLNSRGLEVSLLTVDPAVPNERCRWVNLESIL